jgi:hypothetical protein
MKILDNKIQNTKFTQRPLIWIYDVISRVTNWYQKVTCEHTILSFKDIDYQERYVKCKCDKCGEDVYKDI